MLHWTENPSALRERLPAVRTAERKAEVFWTGKKQLSRAEDALKKLTQEEEALCGELVRQQDEQKKAQEEVKSCRKPQKDAEIRLVEANRELSAAESRLKNSRIRERESGEKWTGSAGTVGDGGCDGKAAA